jgi:cysteine-rich repeat protein
MKCRRVFIGLLVVLASGCSLDTTPLLNERSGGPAGKAGSQSDGGSGEAGAGAAGDDASTDAAVGGSGGAGGASGTAGSSGGAGSSGSAGSSGRSGAGGNSGVGGSAGGSSGAGGGVAPPAQCGDGTVAGNEDCDDGNTVTEICTYGQQSCSVCNNQCKNAAGATSWCGNGSIDTDHGEQCDDGNAVSEACSYGQQSCTICNAACQNAAGATSYCGNGSTDTTNSEQCDDANTVTEACSYGQLSCTVCNSTCRNAAGATSYCGNGTREANNAEQCDDGNTATETCAYGQQSCTVCNATCHSVAGTTSYCGNGSVDAAHGEQCDDSNAITESCAYGQQSCSVCNNLCHTAAGATKYCGNSRIDATDGEQCDDGNTVTESCTTGQASCMVCNATCKRVAGATSFTPQAFSVTGAYYMTADASGTSCVATSLGSFAGHEPAEAGTYPVAVYLVGTFAAYSGDIPQAFTQRMAARGFVASSVEYVNGSYPASCAVLEAKASCVFSSASANSAIAKLCSRPKADCSKGIVVAGLSQGANLATLAKDYDSRVRAAFVMSDIYHPSGYDLQACLQASATTLGPNEMRAVSGDADAYAGGTVNSVRSDLIAVTGRSCGSMVSDCLQNDGSGWYIVKSTDTADATADHCYMMSGGCFGSGLDTTFETGTAEWSLDTNLEWLARQVP